MKEELTGRKVEGFKFEEPFDYVYEMDEYIGAPGEIIAHEIFAGYEYYEVEFNDGESWYYPAELIEEYLCH